ncbi:hypothetical protein ACFY2R_27775 [Micromonospora olivasterospora]|uniref:Uncharacterized protein n=1 Tax=Micromonospora olivasterospora TaxID=1880 RepID=A0A562IFD2_MICOL|nr:hypothetical protein [Micromonospora olivasterospora]TWH69729.1 hypothetical protein JD77_04743 [Micromonospora olivasterospora]
MITEQAPGSPQWAQILISALGLLGGAGGLSVLATVLVQRRKLRTDAAGALTEVALTLVQPLRSRVSELEAEALEVRERMAASQREIQQLRATVWELTRTLERWRGVILAPHATVHRIRLAVAEEDERAPTHHPDSP